MAVLGLMRLALSTSLLLSRAYSTNNLEILEFLGIMAKARFVHSDILPHSTEIFFKTISSKG